MQRQFVTSSAVNAAVENAFVELDSAAQRGAAEMQDIEPGTLAEKQSQLASVRRRLRALTPNVVSIALLEPDWRVILDVPRDAEAALAPGQPVAWTQVTTGERRDVGGRGTILVNGRPHLAVARPLPRERAYVMMHRPRDEVAAAATALLEAMPAVSALTFLWTSAMLGVAAYMVLARLYDDVEGERKRTAAQAARQRQKLIRTRDAIIFGLAKLADSRDPETGDHLERITVYSTTLAAALRRHPKFREQVTPAFIQLIGISSALHDIGKVGIEDRILRKPSALTPAEREKMKSHAEIGGQCLREIELRLGASNFLQMAREIAVAHHEHWDGRGYPHGLAGERIPLAARIVAIADVYDALSSRRIYKDAHAHEECVRIIRDQAGRQFDPDLVDVWLTVSDPFAEIARQYADEADRDTSESPPEVLPEPHEAARRPLVSTGAGVDA